MIIGVIKNLVKERGFGFIKTQDGRNLFFHKTGLKNRRFELLKKGDVVEFDIVQSLKGPKAVNIKVKEEKG